MRAVFLMTKPAGSREHDQEAIIHRLGLRGECWFIDSCFKVVVFVCAVFVGCVCRESVPYGKKIYSPIYDFKYIVLFPITYYNILNMEIHGIIY